MKDVGNIIKFGEGWLKNLDQLEKHILHQNIVYSNVYCKIKDDILFEVSQRVWVDVGLQVLSQGLKRKFKKIEDGL